MPPTALCHPDREAHAKGLCYRCYKVVNQRDRRARIAAAAGRVPHRTGRPPTGRTKPKQKGNIAAQRARARLRHLRHNGDNGTTESQHPLLDHAMAIALRFVRPDRGAVIFRPTYEDTVGAAVLALVADEDAEQAARRVVTEDRDWGYRTCPMSVVLEDQERPILWFE